ncbi:MAG TPA: hypothetical protein VI076_04170, partial [Actinopolymorphaceae bacterium]
MTSASLGVTGVVAGGAFVTSSLKDSARLQVLSDPRVGDIGLGAKGLAKKKSERKKTPKTTTTPKTTATPSPTPTPTPTVDEFLTVEGSEVLDRTAVERRRAAERAARSRERLRSGDPRKIARAMVEARGWSDEQFGCLNLLWNKESGWRVNATNPSSGAYGIPQSLPGSKMARFGSDWRTNPVTQIKWG